MIKVDNFTLVITVKDRQHNLKIISGYYKDLECRKIIVDSSKVIYGDIELLEDRGFEYFYEPSLNYYQKLNKIVNMVSTEYMVECADDDFIRKSAIVNCVNFLERNAGHSLCDGIYAGYMKSLDNENLVVMKYEIPLMNILNTNFYSNYLSTRIAFYLTMRYYPRNHAVVRTKVTKKFYEIMNSNSEINNSIGFVDKYFTFVAAFYGNFGWGSDLYCVRSMDDRLIDGEEIKSYWNFRKLDEDLDDLYYFPLAELLLDDKRKFSSIEDGIKFARHVFKDHYSEVYLTNLLSEEEYQVVSKIINEKSQELTLEEQNLIDSYLK